MVLHLKHGPDHDFHSVTPDYLERVGKKWSQMNELTILVEVESFLGAAAATFAKIKTYLLLQRSTTQL